MPPENEDETPSNAVTAATTKAPLRLSDTTGAAMKPLGLSGVLVYYYGATTDEYEENTFYPVDEATSGRLLATGRARLASDAERVAYAARTQA